MTVSPKRVKWLYGIMTVAMLTSCKAVLIRHVFNGYHEHTGTAFPDLVVVDERDNTLSLGSLKGSVIYLNLWGTWCTACIQEFPYLNKLNDKLINEKGLLVVNICVESDKALWKEMIAEKKLAGVNYFLPDDSLYSHLKKELRIDEGLPNGRIIGKDGVILGNNIGPDEELMCLYALMEARKGTDTRTAAFKLMRVSKKLKKKDDAETKEFISFLGKFSDKK